MRIYDLLSDELTTESNWQLREIHQLRSALKDVDERERSSVARAAFVLLYAHWEGFVKKALEIYVTSLIRLNRPVESLHPGATVLLLRGELYHAMQRGERSNRQIRGIIDLTTRCSGRKLSKNNMKNLTQISNMYFDAFEDLCVICGVDAAEFADDRDYR